MSVINFIILSNDGFVVLGKYVGCDLLEIGFEVFNKVLEDVGLVGFKVQFQEHMMGDDYG